MEQTTSILSLLSTPGLIHPRFPRYTAERNIDRVLCSETANYF
jgi:hypothetical protein